MKKLIIFGVLISTLVLASAILFINSNAQDHSEYEKFYGTWTNESNTYIFYNNGTVIIKNHMKTEHVVTNITLAFKWTIPEKGKLVVSNYMFSTTLTYEFSDNDTILTITNTDFNTTEVFTKSL